MYWFFIRKEWTKSKLDKAITEIIANSLYKEEIIKGTKIIKENDGRDTFYYWINYVLENEYEYLLIPGLSKYHTYQHLVKLFFLEVLYILWKNYSQKVFNIFFVGFFIFLTKCMSKVIRHNFFQYFEIVNIEDICFYI